MMHYLFNKLLHVVLGPQGLDIGDGSRCWYLGPRDCFAAFQDPSSLKFKLPTAMISLGVLRTPEFLL